MCFTDIQLKKLVACDHELSLEYFMHSFSAPPGDISSYPAYACEDNLQGFIDGRCNVTALNSMGYQAYKPEVNTNYYLHMAPSQPYQGESSPYSKNYEFYVFLRRIRNFEL